MRHNDKYEDLCTHYWPEKVTKVKSAMALHLKIYFMSCTNYVPNFMLLSKSAQFTHFSEYAALLLCKTLFIHHQMCHDMWYLECNYTTCARKSLNKPTVAYMQYFAY